MTEPLPESFGAENMDLFIGPPEPPPQVPGEHLWVCYLAIRTTPLESEDRIDVQMRVVPDNLVNMAGPGCFWCEGIYEDVHDMPCPGQPLGG